MSRVHESLTKNFCSPYYSNISPRSASLKNKQGGQKKEMLRARRWLRLLKRVQKLRKHFSLLFSMATILLLAVARCENFQLEERENVAA